MYFRSGNCVGLQCVDNHPTQPHIVATGGQDGTLCIWDMRQDRFPVTLLDAHSAHSKFYVLKRKKIYLYGTISVVSTNSYCNFMLVSNLHLSVTV